MATIRTIYNRRFDEVINSKSAAGIPLTTFFLDPSTSQHHFLSIYDIPLSQDRADGDHIGYRDAPIYRKTNPLATSDDITPSSEAANEAMLKRAGLSLQKILQNEYGDLVKTTPKQPQGQERERLQNAMKLQNPSLAHLSPAEALTKLKTQLRKYQQRQPPFDRPLGKDESVREWWAKLSKKHTSAVDVLAVSDPQTLDFLQYSFPVVSHISLGHAFPQALAIKLYSILVNSMPDERTMSVVTWLNSPRANRQHVGTLRDAAVIRSFSRANPKVSSSSSLSETTLIGYILI